MQLDAMRHNNTLIIETHMNTGSYAYMHGEYLVKNGRSNVFFTTQLQTVYDRMRVRQGRMICTFSQTEDFASSDERKLPS